MVRLTGFEPVWYFYRGILSPLCLPIPPQPQNSLAPYVAYHSKVCCYAKTVYLLPTAHHSLWGITHVAHFCLICTYGSSVLFSRWLLLSLLSLNNFDASVSMVKTANAVCYLTQTRAYSNPYRRKHLHLCPYPPVLKIQKAAYHQ